MEYLHTMVRVSDLDKSLDFYCKKLGLVEIKPEVRPADVSSAATTQNKTSTVKE